MTLEDIKTKAEPILRANDVEYAAIFGSAARGEAQADSDVDFIIRYSKPKGLDHIGLAQELETALGTKVDLVTEKYIYPPLKSFIKKDLQVLYGQGQYL